MRDSSRHCSGRSRRCQASWPPLSRTSDPRALSSGSALSVVFVDPAQYAAVVDEAPGPRFPLAALSGRTRRLSLPAVATAAAAQLLGTAPAEVGVGSQTLTIQLAGRISGVPGVACERPSSWCRSQLGSDHGRGTSCWSPGPGWMRRG